MIADKASSLGDWIRHREETGRPCFSLAEVREAFPGMSGNAIVSSLSRYRANGLVQAVHKGFFAVIPAHYRLNGSAPGYYYVDHLMRHLKRPYYVALLSAASFWGAGHQAVMTTQVMTRLPCSSVSSRKNASLRWFFRSVVPEKFLVRKNGETGTVAFSNPELTALDLVHWAQSVGGLSAVATVLAELRERTDFRGAAQGVFATASAGDVKRLGFVYERVLGDVGQGEIIHAELAKMKGATRYAALVPGIAAEGAERDTRWRVEVNAEIEPEDV